MRAHRALIAAGPDVIHRLCCAADGVSEPAVTALGAIDDPVALLDERPVAVDALWSAALRMLAEGHGAGAIVVHPSWWSAARIGVVSTAATTLGSGAEVRSRSWLLARALDSSQEKPVSVEITDRLIAVSGAQTLAVPRRAEPGEVASAVAAMTGTAPVLIDAAGCGPLAATIADAVRDAVPGTTVLTIDEARLSRLVAASVSPPTGPPALPPAASNRTIARVAAAGAVLTGLGFAVPSMAPDRPRPIPVAAPTTVLVEGRVTLTIPANWAAQRVVSGPGSARVQVTSPADAEVALHVTQSPTPGETLGGAAERLRRAIDAEPAGVFVDFNPTGNSAGRPAVTYREVRAAHDVRWTVLLDGSVRISIGCQSRPSAPDAVRDACEQAVRSAHAVE